MAKRIVVSYDSKKYPSYQDLCEALEIPYMNFMARKQRGFESLEESIEYFLEKKNNALIFKDVRYSTKSELLREYNISHDSVLYRMQVDGSSFIDAFKTVLKNHDHKQKKPTVRKQQELVICGETFETKQAVCKRFDLTYNAFVQKTLQQRGTPEEAVLVLKVPEAKQILREIKAEMYQYKMISIGTQEFSLDIESKQSLSVSLEYAAGGVVKLRTEIPGMDVTYKELNEMNLRQTFGKYVIINNYGNVIVEHRFTTMLYGNQDILFFVFMAIREVDKNERIRRAAKNEKF